MKVKNLVFSGAMASILMMGAAVAEAPTQAKDVWGVDTLGKLQSSLTAAKPTWNTDNGTLSEDKLSVTAASGNVLNMNDTEYTVGGNERYKIDGLTAGTGDSVEAVAYGTDEATQKYTINSADGKQYANIAATFSSKGNYDISYGETGIDYKHTIGSGDVIKTYTLNEKADTETFSRKINDTTTGYYVFEQKVYTDAEHTIEADAEVQKEYDILRGNYDGNLNTFDSMKDTLGSQYSEMSGTVSDDNSALSALKAYGASATAYNGTFAQLLDDSYGQKLTQTLGYDVALKNITDEDVLGTDVVSAIKGNTDAIATKADKSEVEGLVKMAKEQFDEKEAWVGEILGINTGADKATTVKNEYAGSNYLKESTSFTSADKALDAQIKTNADEIAKRTVSLDETEEGLEFATITDGTNSANVYTKEAAEAIFAEKQQWVDTTLGINSADTDAVKNEYAGTNYLGLSTTLTDADIALDSAIKNNANAIDDLNKSMRETDAKLRNDIAALDSKVNDLDENLSAGIASSVALSAVEVSNVKKGEMSVGGGYGNYNSKSAMAFGAALGLTDNWSANAGVGLGFGKDTKASFRVGTNYKFKLF